MAGKMSVVQAFNVAASSHPSPLLGTPFTSKRRFNPPRNDSRVHRASRSSRGTLRTSCRLVSYVRYGIALILEHGFMVRARFQQALQQYKWPSAKDYGQLNGLHT